MTLALASRNFPICKKCIFYAVDKVCLHSNAEYVDLVDGSLVRNTCEQMRNQENGACGAPGRLFQALK